MPPHLQSTLPRFDALELTRFAESLLIAASMPPDRARDVADVLVEGDLPETVGANEPRGGVELEESREGLPGVVMAIDIGLRFGNKAINTRHVEGRGQNFHEPFGEPALADVGFLSSSEHAAAKKRSSTAVRPSQRRVM